MSLSSVVGGGRARALASVRPVSPVGGRGGEVARPVGEVPGAEGRAAGVLPDGRRHRRPGVRQSDLGLRRAQRHRVVTPGPAAELQVATLLLLRRAPADGARRVEYMNLVGHLVLPERVIGVVRAQPGDLPCLG
ncbi:hypothetical protein C0R03_05150 [Streptomyces albidoflavus]|nr:hypothetical protein C0R03_05150 [Streptomyces albidoflavus]